MPGAHTGLVATNQRPDWVSSGQWEAGSWAGLLPLTVMVGICQYWAVIIITPVTTSHWYQSDDHNNLRPQWHLPYGPSLSYLRCQKLNCLADHCNPVFTQSIANWPHTADTPLHTSPQKAGLEAHNISIDSSKLTRAIESGWRVPALNLLWHGQGPHQEVRGSKKPCVKVRMDQEIARSDPSYCSQPGVHWDGSASTPSSLLCSDPYD